MASSTFLHFNSLLLQLLLLPTVFSIIIPNCQIKLNSSLSADGKSSWNSPSGEFAFGFRNVPFGDEGFAPLLSIWFTKVPNETIVWFAKDVGAPPDSTVQLRNNGLIVYDPQGNQKWRRPKNNSTFCVIMQDNGNLVLLDENGRHVWESFEEPSDTILPGQTLKWPQTLRARQSDISFLNGSFELMVQQDGNLVLYRSPEGNEIGREEKIAPYWASGALTSGSELTFNEFGQIYIRNGSKVIYNATKGIPGSREFYFMARMDSDGVFRLYNFRRLDNGSAGGCVQGWNILENVPDDICLTFTSQTGSVICGFNSYCVNINGKTECWCPDHYSPFSYNNQTSCRPDFPLPFCQVDGWEMKKEQVKIVEYNNLDWAWSDYDILIGTSIDKDVCRQNCLQDCFCAAAIYDNLDKGYCWKKKYPLSNGRKSKRVTRTAFVKVPAVNLKKKQHKNQSTLVLIISVLLGSSVFFNILLFISFLVAFSYFYHKKLLNLQKVSSLSSATVRWYTYKELEDATGGYKQVLGKGSFGTVYKGILSLDTRRYVAVKKLDKVIQEGEREFKTEMNAIGQTHHRNLVRLLGYCDEGENRLLVYEYMSNGTLASFLFGISRPHWSQRVQTAVGIARGLTYLHEECSTQIIHCDIKPQNILLDDLFTPRISDFGLAKLLLADQTRAARTGIRGTVGYFAPEWFRKGSITTKVDVYSFGVVLLEIICCKSCVSFSTGNEEEALIDWAYNCYIKKKLAELVDNDEEAKNDKRLEKLVMVAIWCIQDDPSLRPAMKNVTQMLEGVVKVSVPPRPSVFNFSS